MLAWRKKASDIAQQRRQDKQTEEQIASTMCSAATLAQAVWRSYNTRKVRCSWLTFRVYNLLCVAAFLSQLRSHRGTATGKGAFLELDSK